MPSGSSSSPVVAAAANTDHGVASLLLLSHYKCVRYVAPPPSRAGCIRSKRAKHASPEARGSCGPVQQHPSGARLAALARRNPRGAQRAVSSMRASKTDSSTDSTPTVLPSNLRPDSDRSACVAASTESNLTYAQQSGL